MSENVTFERREPRPPQDAVGRFGPPFLALLGQDDGSLDTNSLKLVFLQDSGVMEGAWGWVRPGMEGDSFGSCRPSFLGGVV